MKDTSAKQYQQLISFLFFSNLALYFSKRVYNKAKVALPDHRDDNMDQLYENYIGLQYLSELTHEPSGH